MKKLIVLWFVVAGCGCGLFGDDCDSGVPAESVSTSVVDYLGEYLDVSQCLSLNGWGWLKAFSNLSIQFHPAVPCSIQNDGTVSENICIRTNDHIGSNGKWFGIGGTFSCGDTVHLPATDTPGWMEPEDVLRTAQIWRHEILHSALGNAHASQPGWRCEAQAWPGKPQSVSGVLLQYDDSVCSLSSIASE